MPEATPFCRANIERLKLLQPLLLLFQYVRLISPTDVPTLIIWVASVGPIGMIIRIAIVLVLLDWWKVVEPSTLLSNEVSRIHSSSDTVVL